MDNSNDSVLDVPRHALLTVREVAEYLRTTPAAIYARIYRGTLTGVARPGRGRTIYIRRAALLESLRNGADR
jgi:excisionase family DNA binding protein